MSTELRVLVISSRDISHPKWAGGDVYLHEILSRLAKGGDEVMMVCDRYPGAPKLSVASGILVQRVSPGLLRPVRNIAIYLRYRNWADVVIEEVEGPAGPFFSPLYVRKPLVGLWHQPARKILFAQYPSLIAGLLTTLDFVYARMLRGRAIIVPSTSSAAEINRLGIPPTRIFVVPGAPEDGPRNQEPVLSQRSPFFLTLGKYRKYKCFDHAILALKSVLKTHPECNLLVAGGRTKVGAEEESLRHISKVAGVDDHVSFLPLSSDEKNWALANSVGLIVPGPIEGFSLVAVEANSLGTPVVASSGVPTDVVLDGINGLRYHFGDIEELSKVMTFLLENRDDWSEKCIKFSEGFTWDRSSQILRMALSSVISSFPAGAEMAKSAHGNCAL